MTKILIFGAGRSSVYLIKKTQQYCVNYNCTLTLVDENFDKLPRGLKGHSKTTYVESSVKKNSSLESEVSSHDIVISMLPPDLHIAIAQTCLLFKKNLLTASYVSEEMKLLDAEVKKEGLLFLNEIGVDPGLDHISALTFLDKIKLKGGIVKSFKSHTGGIISEKTKDNLWNYRITWNPKNVVEAGCDGAIFLEDRKIREVKYSKLFSHIEKVKIENEYYDSYPNRDSLKYIEKYKLEGLDTCYRGTLRHEGYCSAWDVFVQIGMTKSDKVIQLPKGANRQDFLSFFLNIKNRQSVREVFLKLLEIDSGHSIEKKFDQLGFFDNAQALKLVRGTPAEILQSILEISWKIEPSEKDMLLMHHEVEFEFKGKIDKATSSLKVIGEDQNFTAMSITVGAPLFEALRLVIENKIELKGVQIPTNKELYSKLYENLNSHNLFFKEAFLE